MRFLTGKPAPRRARRPKGIKLASTKVFRKTRHIYVFAKGCNEKQKGEGAPGAKLKALAIGTALPTSRGFLPPELLLLLVTKVESKKPCQENQTFNIRRP